MNGSDLVTRSSRCLALVAALGIGSMVGAAGCRRAPAPAPDASPSGAAAPAAGPEAATATTLPAPADPFPASPPPAAPVAANTPAVASSATASPSPNPEDAKRAEQEEKLKAELAAAKKQADDLTTQANTECPDLKPGELRHPGAISRCARLHREADAAVQRYEAAKKDAQAAGIAVQ